MKAHVLAAALFLASQAPASAGTLEIIGAPGQVANDSTNFILTFATMQWVYTAPSFGVDAIRITGMAMRFDQIAGRQTFPGQVDWTTDPGFYLKLGVVSGMGSNVQADNRNPTLTTVLAGSKTMPISVGADFDETKPWTIVFQFDSPFDYDPALGNLMVEANIVRGPEIPGRPGAYHTLTADAIYAGPYGRGIAPASATNQYSYNLPVAQFAFGEVTSAPGGVPEPATWALMIFGFGLVGGLQRRRATRPLAA
jgi:hypothetical protein